MCSSDLGLEPDPAAQLWENMEDTYGQVEGFEAALARTRGVPLALRREYARARFGAGAWDLTTLDAPARAALEALAILRAPVAPAAVSALSPGVEIEAALTSLVAHQLVDSLGDGRVVVHEVVRVDVLGHMANDNKQRLLSAAA